MRGSKIAAECRMPNAECAFRRSPVLLLALAVPLGAQEFDEATFEITTVAHATKRRETTSQG